MLTRVSFSSPMKKRSDDKKDKGVPTPFLGLLILLLFNVVLKIALARIKQTSFVEKNHENVGFLVSELVSGSFG